MGVINGDLEGVFEQGFCLGERALPHPLKNSKKTGLGRHPPAVLTLILLQYRILTHGDLRLRQVPPRRRNFSRANAHTLKICFNFSLQKVFCIFHALPHPKNRCMHTVMQPA